MQAPIQSSDMNNINETYSSSAPLKAGTDIDAYYE